MTSGAHQGLMVGHMREIKRSGSPKSRKLDMVCMQFIPCFFMAIMLQCD
jgi:hypothetical protein